MAKTGTPSSQDGMDGQALTLLDELRPRAEQVSPDFAYFSGLMDLLDHEQFGVNTVAHALARAGAVADARRLVARVKSSSRRGPLRGVALGLAERGDADAARQAARELPATGLFAAKKTLVEVGHALACRGDFAEAIRTAEGVEDAEASARALERIAMMQAEVPVGNFANDRVMPERRYGHSFADAEWLCNHAARRDQRVRSAFVQTLRRALERARAIPKAGDKYQVLDFLIRDLSWAGDAEGAVLAAQAHENAAQQGKLLVRAVEGLTGRGDFDAAEQVANGIPGKASRTAALAKVAAGREHGYKDEARPYPPEPWQTMLEYCEKDPARPDDRLTGLLHLIWLRLQLGEATKGLLAALLRVRRALTEGDAAIKEARLQRDEIQWADNTGKWNGKILDKGEAGIAVTRQVRLCRIAWAQVLAGDLAAARETVALIPEGDLRACGLALVLSGYLEYQERLRFARGAV
jgi:hypothetical protein